MELYLSFLKSLELIIETIEKIKLDGFNIVYDAAIIRGQGYYTGTVLEVFDDDFGRAIGGGGRYDKMIEKMVGMSVSAVGVSMGFEPITMLIRERGLTFNSKANLALIYDEEDNIVFDNLVHGV